MIETIQPLLSKHFNLTVEEMPLKAMVRSHNYAVIPTKLDQIAPAAHKLMKEMGSRYLFIVLYVWLERTLSRGDHRVGRPPSVRKGTGS